MMIGGDVEAVKHLDPIFATLAPSVDSAGRTEGKTGEPSTAEHGYLHCGPSGAGHFVKMVHNGIEYGIMGLLRRGAGDPGARQYWQAPTGVRRRDNAASRPEALPV